MTVESCNHNLNHTHSRSNAPQAASPISYGPDGRPLVPETDCTQQVGASKSTAASSTANGSTEDAALVGVFDRITLRLESFETAQRTAVQQVRQELVAAIGELASTKRARATAEVEASRRDPFGYGWTYPLYAPFRAPYSPSDYSNLPPLVDHSGKVTSTFTPSQETLKALQAESEAAYLRLASKVNGEEWQVVDGPSLDEFPSTEQSLSPPTLPTTPIIVSPSSSTVQSSNIIVNIPTLPLVSPASIADSSEVSSDSSSDSDVSTSSEENDEEEDCHVEIEVSSESSSESSEESDISESEDEEDEEKENFNPTVAKLEISLLQAKLKLAKLQYARYLEMNPVVVASGEKEEDKVEVDSLWAWEERKMMVDKLVKRKSSPVKVYVEEVVEDLEEKKPVSRYESIE